MGDRSSRCEPPLWRGRAAEPGLGGRRIYALRNTCPHQGARLSDGVVTCTRVSGRVGEYRADRDGRIVRCPWHNWEFDAADGRSLHNPDRARVATYKARVDGRRILVEM